MATIKGLRRPILGQIIPSIDRPGQPSTARLAASPAYDRTMGKTGQVLSSRSTPHGSNGGFGSAKGAALKGHAFEWRGFYTPGGWGAWTPFPLIPPGDNVTFPVEFHWTWTEVFPPYKWGTISVEGFCDEAGFGWPVGLTLLLGSTNFIPKNGDNFQLTGKVEQPSIDAINAGAWDGTGIFSLPNNPENILDSVYFALYTSPYPYNGLGHRVTNLQPV